MSRQRIARFGWVRDLPDHRDRVYSVDVRMLAALPPAIDLRAQCPAVYDQGRIGSCTANAIAGAIQFDRMKRGQAPDFTPSRLFIYYNERVIESDVPLDRGAQIRDGIKSVADQGVCPENEWPYDDTPAPFDGGPFPPGSLPATEPTPACYTDAAKYKSIVYSRVNQTLSQLKGCLAGAFPFVFGFTVYDSFFEANGHQKTIIPFPAGSDSPVGGHAVLCVGYQDDKQLFIVRNSWGTGEGESGYCYMPYSYLTDQNLSSDFWVIETIGG